jgi:branched-chain amino acid aminotransferase
LQEVFGTGTAAIISPVGLLSYKGDEIEINNMEIGPIAQNFYDTILGLVHGEVEDKYGWNLHLNV